MASNLSSNDRRVCRCGECQKWRRSPKLKGPNVNNWGRSILWRGSWWAPIPHGYYRSSYAGGLLHREIWKTHCGPIPEGYDVHHIDDDPGNNQPSNLELKEHGSHTTHHLLKKRFRCVVCVVCGTQFKTRSIRETFYCSGRCGAEASWVRHGHLPKGAACTKICVGCGKKFVVPSDAARRIYCYECRGSQRKNHQVQRAGL